ncbi:MAG: YkgJ family cysteine cluster protein [Fibrobacterota bacterium]
MTHENPCLTCGACCAHFLVPFFAKEADPEQNGTVPRDYTEPFDEDRLCLLGTNQLAPRCAALQGEIGHAARCGIYDRRPSPCRNFGVQWENNRIASTQKQIDRCNEARVEWELPPLKPED